MSGHAYVGVDGSIAPYPGPIGSIISPGLLGLEQFGHLAQASSLCGACKDICPVDIDLPKLLTRVRAGNPSSETQNAQSKGIGLSLMSRVGLKAFGVIASSAWLFDLSQKVAGLGTQILSPFSQWMWIPAFTGWGYSKDLPRFATKTFRERFHREATENTEILKKEKVEEKEIDAPKVQNVNLVERFSQELETVGGHAYRVEQNELSSRLIGFLKERDINAAMIWDSISGLDGSALSEAGVRVERSVDPTLKAGITGALSVIAETGTLVIPSGKGQPLSASLLAEFHIAIIHSSQIVWSLDEALQKKEVRNASAVALVTGPSRTADIEMTLTIGVHGPKELHVFVVDD